MNTGMKKVHPNKMNLISVLIVCTNISMKCRYLNQFKVPISHGSHNNTD